MKGLTHFMTGVCVATFFPVVVAAAYDPDLVLLTLLIPIGGLFGYLPDFLDFKFSRYVEREDIAVSPGYEDLDPWRVAEGIAEAINRSYKSEKPVKLKLHTIRMPNGLWRRYSVLFRQKTNEVEVKIGPLITTGLEVMKGTEPEEEKVAIVKYKPDLEYSYEDVTNVDIWDGPTFQFRREGDKIYADFIQWHRRWSHSLTIGVFFGILMAVAAGYLYLINGVTLTDFQILTIIGIVIGGVWGHVIVDQLGWLGSNLLWPITGKRKTGMGLTRSMDPLANFITTYLLTILILWNLNRFAPKPVFPWNNLQFFLYLVILPLALILAGLYIYYKRNPQKEKTRDREEMDEVAMEIAQF
ncbi:MAG: metal-dependent hydrolase [Promethearchaeia archaeon]